MNPSPNEKLSDYLAALDSDLLDSAFAVDNAQKLRKYAEASRRNMPFYRKSAFRGAIAAAACLALITGVLLAARQQGNTGPDIQIEAPPATGQTHPEKPSVPEQPSEQKPPVDIIPPWETLSPDTLTIENADMLNYYTALRLLAEQTQAAQTTSGTEGSRLHLLTNTATEETVPGDTEGPPIAPPTRPTEPEGGYEKYYYEFDPDAPFFVSRVTFLQIELTDPEGFLASKVGCGIVDVVITNNSIDNMITFKNGDRYYSCLKNGQSQTEIRFSTHKYIEGFAVVKNMDPESYQFTVSFDGNQITGCPQVIGMVCAPFDAGSQPDGDLRIVSKTYTTEVNAAFTVAELEEYFSNGTLPPQITGA